MTRRSGVALLVVLAAVFGAALALGVAALVGDDPSSAPATAAPGAVDIGFAQDMAVHHEQALVMAQYALDRPVSSALRGYARQIVLTQGQEQGMLRGWLALWDTPLLPREAPMGWMPHGSHGHHGGSMPGMATQAELTGLAGLQGKAFEREFLRLMIRHHEGGIAMAAYAEGHARLQPVRSLAAVMARAQAQEVTAFRRLAGDLVER